MDSTIAGSTNDYTVEPVKSDTPITRDQGNMSD
jgi:hypothetical protein